ncbi:MaoC/PaaZ C-terminal domain-containing protein [Oceanicoccus sp. KOV_DT_Chl]|uniref:MaoC/PaaZ C-terminal domain-containing protein n=1 Tax=Oceanicoccus sp. KOV_DT_Chl TaxID=1904639 RepID=UPI000C7D978F|nr:MaoC/PaaZ C-terminal domain-containing protein [Oceanicoccus sp. KOV_DT_Chl]
MSTLQNVTYDEITIGQTASYSKTLSEDDLVMFAAVSGDVNPVHLDAEFAASTMFQERIGHGAWTGSVISAALALELPGPGTIYLGQSLSFRAPVKIGDTVTVELEVTAKNDAKKFVTLNTTAINQHGKTVAKGSAEVMAPTEKLVLPKPVLPAITIG